MDLRTIHDDNQVNTFHQLLMLKKDGVALISDWDESQQVSKLVGFYEIRNCGGQAMGSELRRNDSYIRSEAVVARIVAGETLVVPIRSSVGDLASIYSFNGTGTLIWKLLETPRSAAQLASYVAEEYEVDLAQAETDVAQFLSELKSLGLIDVPTSLAMAGD